MLIDEQTDQGYYSGRTISDAPEVDNEVLVSGENLSPGTFVPVDITDAMEYDLIGRISRQSPLSDHNDIEPISTECESLV